MVTKDGTVVLKLKKENKEFMFCVSNIGYESVDLTLSKDINYKIELYLNRSSSLVKAIDNQIVFYKF